LSDVSFAAALNSNASLELDDNDIDAGERASVAVLSFGDEDFTTFALRDSRVSGGELASVWIEDGDSVIVEGNTLDASSSDPGASAHGNALFARSISIWDDDARTGLLASGNELIGTIGPAVLLDGASATLDGNTWIGGEGLDLLQQNCLDYPAPVGLDASVQAELCPEVQGLTYQLDWFLFPEIESAQGQ
jgi:hypothetical protein